MSQVDELLNHYERELVFLRSEGAEFARKYSKVAGRLLLDQDKCEDPHIERLIEAVALLCARIQRKLDDEFPEVTSALLGVLQPQGLAPLPSFSVAQFVSAQERSVRVPRGTLLSTPLLPEYETRCRFQTCFDVEVLPLGIRAVSLELPGKYRLPGACAAASVLRMQVSGTASDLSCLLELTRLRVMLDGELRYALYQALLPCCTPQAAPQVFLRVAPEMELHALELHPVGFMPAENLLPRSGSTHPGYLTLQEYFAFPQKFLFFEVRGLLAAFAAQRARGRPLSRDFELLFCLPERSERLRALNAQQLRLGCTPIVNMFPQIAEPIALDHTQSEYAVVPDARRRRCIEVYSVDEVSGISTSRAAPRGYSPLYASRCGEGDDARKDRFYATTRRGSGEPGSSVYLTLIDPSLQADSLPDETLLVRTTCTNRDLPAKLYLPAGSLLELFPDEPLMGVQVHALERPTPTYQRPLGQDVQWRLISQMSLNHLSLTDDAAGLAAFQELLKLNQTVSSDAPALEVSGLTALKARRIAARTPSEGFSFCRGIEVTIELDEECFVGRSPLLFAAVLESFFAQYVSLNSFVQLVARSRAGKELKRWPPRSGDQTLL